MTGCYQLVRTQGNQGSCNGLGWIKKDLDLYRSIRLYSKGFVYVVFKLYAQLN